MLKKCVVLWIVVLFVSCQSVFANLTTVSLVNDYQVTNDVSDIVHLGDQTISTFIQKIDQGSLFSYSFELPDAAESGIFSIHFKLFNTNPELGYYNHVYINGNDLGYLCTSSVHWISDTLTGDNSLLLADGDNELEIIAGKRGSNYDDFEFTGVSLSYNAVPLPGTLLLLVSGVACMRAKGFAKK